MNKLINFIIFAVIVNTIGFTGILGIILTVWGLISSCSKCLWLGIILIVIVVLEKIINYVKRSWNTSLFYI